MGGAGADAVAAEVAAGGAGVGGVLLAGASFPGPKEPDFELGTAPFHLLSKALHATHAESAGGAEFMEHSLSVHGSGGLRGSCLQSRPIAALMLVEAKTSDSFQSRVTAR